MFRRRTLATVALIPALFALAACGSTSVNTSGVDESVSAAPSNAVPTGASTPNSQATSGLPGIAAASSAAGGSGSGSGSGSAGSGSTGSGSTGTTSHQASGSKSPSHPVTSVPRPQCVWQTGAPEMLVTPCANLSDGQTVTVYGRDLTPGKGVIAIECAYFGNSTNQNDCNISGAGGLQTLLTGGTQPSANRTATLTLTVNKSFQGGGGTTFTCSSRQACVVALTSPQDTNENNTAPISFN